MNHQAGRAFIVRPFGKKPGVAGESAIDFDKVDKELISIALEQVGFTGGTTGEFIQQGNIRADMFRELLVADLVIADISIHNANTFYELGIRHALRGQYTVIIKSKSRGDPHVFDLNSDRYLPYDPDNPKGALDDLVNTIKATLANEKPDSPVFQLLPGLESFDPSKVVVVPRKFREKVEQNAKNNKNLLKLRTEITGEAWETEGLRLIGRALFALRDHKGSSDTWERIRTFDMYDLEANQRLATDYQRLGEFVLSDQAVKRALDSTRISDWDAAEACALAASNHKTQWLAVLDSAPNLEERQRQCLTSPFLGKSFELYGNGFERHRSHYYSGLNAVAMLMIQVELAKLHPDRWALQFKNERFAELELEEREEHLSKLIAATFLAIDSSVRNYPDDPWARISRADLKLLTSKSPEKIKLSYEQCATIEAFNLGSLERQLGVYQNLALFKENVSAALGVVRALKEAGN